MGKKKTVTLGSEKQSETEAGLKETKKAKSKNKIRKIRLHKRSKKYLTAKSQIVADKLYSLKDALILLKKIAFEEFDSSLEVHINTNENNLKGEVNLPHGTGKTVRIVNFDSKSEAKIKEGKIDFDILLALPKDMAQLVKYAKILGPKGLMPSPKKGTLTDDLAKATKKFSKGTVNFKSEAKFPLLHQVIGKKSFTEKQLEENIRALISSINLKYISKLFLKTSMSPSVQIDLKSL